MARSTKRKLRLKQRLRHVLEEFFVERIRGGGDMEVSERLCTELQPDLRRLHYKITGLRLVDTCVGLFLKRREKVYLLTVSNTVNRQL